MPPTTISVALCTHNGAQYLSEQLESILQQTRLPDELIVSDDCSNDETLAFASEFARRAPFPVTVLQNQHQLGSTANFERALRHCQGDFIALSDQDDRWMKERLHRCSIELERQRNATLLFSDGLLIDQHGQPLPGSLWQRFGFAGQRLKCFRDGDYRLLCRERFVTGATVMLRRSALGAALPIPTEWVHDAWLAILLSFSGDLIALDEPCIEYRIHAEQQVGARPSRLQARTSLEHWRRIHRERLQSDALEARLRQYPPTIRGELIATYRDRALFLRFRDASSRSRLARFAAILRHLRGYQEQADGAASALKDWLFSRKEAPNCNPIHNDGKETSEHVDRTG